MFDKKVFKIGGIAAYAGVVIIAIQIAVFISFPPPQTPLEFFDLFNRNWILGLLSLDLLYIVNNTILIFTYLALFAALWRVNFTYMLVALVLGLMGISAYYSSNVAFEMMSLSGRYHAAGTQEKQQYIAAGHALLAIYKGTAFNIYYVLNAIVLLVISTVMFRDSTFSKPTAFCGAISSILMLVPSTAGTVGMILSLISLFPWIIFSVLVAKRLFRMSTIT